MNIAVLLGGISPERNISLLSGRAITFALRGLGHNVTAVDPMRGSAGVLNDADLNAAYAAEVTDTELRAFDTTKLVECLTIAEVKNADVVFIALHGKYGEDGYMQALLDLHKIPFTGSGMLASAVAMDKGMSKMMMQVAGIPSPHWVSVHPKDAADLEMLEEILREINGKMVVKPNDQGSTVGMTIVESGSSHDLQIAIELAGKYSDIVLVERYIPGREITVAVLGTDALPVIEIEPKDGFYDYENKYTKGKTDYQCPADLSEEVQFHVQNLAVAAHSVLGCKAFSRVDFRLTEDGMPFCLEVNTIPGFTETSLVPMAAKEAGIEFGALCEEIIRLSLDS
ncbi:MAG: D-alanine--D-alanine ligase [Ignavibacteria bacterium]|nr:D-alanine--D-alanine ligase [Ignavibacteria bacterium]